MKTKLCLLLVMAVLAMSQLAYGQANGCSTPHAAAVEPAGTTFIILVPVQGPPVQYQYIGSQYITRRHAYYHQGYRQYRYGYGSGYGSGYRSFYSRSARYGRNPRTGAVYLLPNRHHGW